MFNLPRAGSALLFRSVISSAPVQLGAETGRQDWGLGLGLPRSGMALGPLTVRCGVETHTGQHLGEADQHTPTLSLPR